MNNIGPQKGPSSSARITAQTKFLQSELDKMNENNFITVKQLITILELHDPNLKCQFVISKDDQLQIVENWHVSRTISDPNDDFLKIIMKVNSNGV